jgi:hypothetical protein
MGGLEPCAKKIAYRTTKTMVLHSISAVAEGLWLIASRMRRERCVHYCMLCMVQAVLFSSHTQPPFPAPKTVTRSVAPTHHSSTRVMTSPSTEKTAPYGSPMKRSAVIQVFEMRTRLPTRAQADVHPGSKPCVWHVPLPLKQRQAGSWRVPPAPLIANRSIIEWHAACPRSHIIRLVPLTLWAACARLSCTRCSHQKSRRGPLPRPLLAQPWRHCCFRAVKWWAGRQSPSSQAPCSS